jgi:hypothetical protein
MVSAIQAAPDRELGGVPYLLTESRRGSYQYLAVMRYVVKRAGVKASP